DLIIANDTLSQLSYSPVRRRLLHIQSIGARLVLFWSGETVFDEAVGRRDGGLFRGDEVAAEQRDGGAGVELPEGAQFFDTAAHVAVGEGDEANDPVGDFAARQLAGVCGKRGAQRVCDLEQR